jgi:hypothetical protein
MMTTGMKHVRRGTWAMPLVLAAAGVALLASGARAQDASTDNSFRWAARIPNGAWLRISNLNGAIRVTAGSGDQTVVTAEKQWRLGDPSRVRIQTVRDGDNIVICALWHERDECTAEGARYHTNNDEDHERHQDVSVAFTVQLPRGVRIDAGTVNGDVTVHDATSEVRAHTVNGSVEAYTSGGPVSAHTVNGGVRARAESLAGSDDLDYSTVNGSVTVTLPATLAAMVDMSTVNGSIQTDFPLTIQGRMRPTRLSGAVGGGGSRHVRIRTVNGSIELLKGSGG